MKTAEQWLKIPDDKLPVELAKVLTPRDTKHKFGETFLGRKGRLKRCQRCGKTFPLHTKQNKCVPDPITIDWNTAMEWRDKTERQHFHPALVDVMDTVASSDIYRYPALMESLLVSFTQPKHYLIAAAMSKGEI